MPRKRRCSPPPTAHRLAAWLSLAGGITAVAPKQIRFLPSDDDLRSFHDFWQYRLYALQQARVAVLQRPNRFERALACMPYAYSYSGGGECCRLSFCPYCNAADAAAAYERIRRVVQSRRNAIGFVANRLSSSEKLSQLPHDLQAYFAGIDHPPAVDFPGADDSLGSIIKYTIWPHALKKGQVILRSRHLRAVSAEYARLVYDVFLKTRKAPLDQDKGWTWQNPFGFNSQEMAAHKSEDYAVRPAPVSLARAAAYLFQYPVELLTEDPQRVADVINAMTKLRMSTVRGVLRSALPLSPQRFPLQFVPTNPKGVGCVDWVLSQLPVADESLVASEFAHIFGVARADTFAALSPALALPVYWLGDVKVKIADLVRPTKSSELYQAVAKYRPAQPGDRHALVFTGIGQGPMVMSTWPPVLTDYRSACNDGAALDDVAMFVNVRAKGRHYTLETPKSFGHRCLWTARREKEQSS